MVAIGRQTEATAQEIVVEIAPPTAAIVPAPIVPARPIARVMPAIVVAPATAPSRAVEAIVPRRTRRAPEAALNVSSGRAASAASARGRASFASAGGGAARVSAGGGGFHGGGGGGGFRGGGGGGFRGGGGGRRSDLALKHDVVLLGHLDNGLGYYRFSYLGSDKAYVGVIAQEVQTIRPDAVTRGSDGYLRVYYEKLGLKFSTYRDWLAGGAKIPTSSEVSP